jgi:uncharacterized protein YfaP (DUF2135 family)
VLETLATWVYGETSPDAVVAVNGGVADIDPTGSFFYPVALDEGANLVEVTSTRGGGSTTAQHAVFALPATEGVPLDVTFPTDGLVTDIPAVWVLGATDPQNVVAVNGNPVDVDGLGLFKVEVQLTGPSDVIEVTATNLNGETHTVTLAVFYTGS